MVRIFEWISYCLKILLLILNSVLYMLRDNISKIKKCLLYFLSSSKKYHIGSSRKRYHKLTIDYLYSRKIQVINISDLFQSQEAQLLCLFGSVLTYLVTSN